MEADLLAITEDDRAETEAAMEDLLCPICLDLLHRPHRLQPCQHLFCEPCLRRLAGARIQNCPVCRSPIKDCHLDQELHDSIEDQHQDEYIQRQQAEMNSGIFNLPLPPVRRTLGEFVNEWLEESLTPDLVELVMLILQILFLIGGVIFMMKLVLDQGEESPAVAIYQSLRPVMRVLTIAKLLLLGIFFQLGFIIELNDLWLRFFALPGRVD